MADKELKAKIEEIRINVKDWRIDLDAGVFEGTPEDVRTPEDLLAYIDVLESRQPDTELVEALEEIARYTHGSTNRKAEYVNAQATKALDKYKGKE